MADYRGVRGILSAGVEQGFEASSGAVDKQRTDCRTGGNHTSDYTTKASAIAIPLSKPLR